METSEEQFKNLVAQRLLENVGVAVKQNKLTTKRGDQGKETIEKNSVSTGNEMVLTLESDFVKIEKNLASFGFFTPSSKRIKNAKAKTIYFTRWVDGKRIEAKVTIVPAALYGLPITADQDKSIAFQKIVDGIRQEVGIIKNPIGFTSAELLRLLGKYRDSGKNYQEIVEWLDVMTATTIMSEGAIYFAGKKVWAKDRFHVFERAVSIGKEMPDGTIADKNYIWLSEWQLENVNNNYLLPIDFDTYKQLKNHIAKALVPLLQIWLYATRDEGYFEKRYDELCQLLSVRQYRHLSQIKLWFAPSLDELKQYSYLADWQIEKTSDGKAYKIIFYHGEKFHRDRKKRLEQKEQRGPRRKPKLIPTTIEPAEQGSEQKIPVHTLTEEEKSLFKQLNLDFGVLALKAFELVKERLGQTRIQLEAWPYRNNRPNNPAGFIIEAIENDYQLPQAYFDWKADQEAKARLEANQTAIQACTFCDASGFRIVWRETGSGQKIEAAKPCTHKPEIEHNYPSAI